MLTVSANQQAADCPLMACQVHLRCARARVKHLHANLMLISLAMHLDACLGASAVDQIGTHTTCRLCCVQLAVQRRCLVETVLTQQRAAATRKETSTATLQVRMLDSLAKGAKRKQQACARASLL